MLRSTGSSAPSRSTADTATRMQHTLHKVYLTGESQRIGSYDVLRPDGQPGFDTPSGKFEIASSVLAEYGYDRTQAYMIASVAVDMRIGQLVDVPNVGVTAVLPLDIFVGRD